MAETAPAIKQRPEKPDEAKFKAELAEAEKEWKAAQEKLVCISHSAGAGLAPSDLHRMLSKQNSTSPNQVTKTRPRQKGNRNCATSFLRSGKRNLALRTHEVVFKTKLFPWTPN